MVDAVDTVDRAVIALTGGVATVSMTLLHIPTAVTLKGSIIYEFCCFCMFVVSMV